MRIRSEHQVYDFVKTAKIYARLGSINEKKGDLKTSIEWYEKSLLEDQSGHVKLELKKVQKAYTIK